MEIHTLVNERFLQACRRQRTDVTPVWFMRQAGRYDPDYRKIRERHSLLDICAEPELCAEVTMMPVRKLGVDAAILFSDIMVPVGAMGLEFSIRENVGPVIAQPIRTKEDIENLRPFTPSEALPHVLTSIRLLRAELDIPLIGFTGGPFTLASYMIEGGPSRDYLQTKTMMVSRPDLWQTLMDKLADMVIHYGRAQVEAGASALQVFDSWVGSLSVDAFRKSVKPFMTRIFHELRKLDVPLIYFGVNTGELLGDFAETGANVIGVDWRVPLSRARARVGNQVALQGNFDPAMLFAPIDVIDKLAQDILDEGTATPGYVFNLGHGVKPSTDLGVLRHLVETVHAYTPRQTGQGAR
ncbi:uroporphyrinogen decarboxylase [Alicyclobacillus hesperidum]|uniref:uroporphyrinogen decarboxylase n=1 Tax=Alicyclobacillus hesperidum TaxID=89784 RepID=UPI0002E5B76A|nr:uroporphyrinogen decarboxylase [Alicyclobacillus hesperidum]